MDWRQSAVEWVRVRGHQGPAHPPRLHLGPGHPHVQQVQYSTVQYSTGQVSSCSVTIICQLATIHSKLSPTRLLLLLLGIVDVLKYPFLAPLSLIRWSWCMHAQQNLHSEARGWLYTNPIRWCRTRVQWPEPSAYIITEMNSLLLWVQALIHSWIKIFWFSLQSISF